MRENAFSVRLLFLKLVTIAFFAFSGGLQNVSGGITIQVLEVGSSVRFDVLAGGSLDLNGWTKSDSASVGPPRLVNFDVLIPSRRSSFFVSGNFDSYSHPSGTSAITWSGDFPTADVFDTMNVFNTAPSDWAWGIETPGAMDVDAILVPDDYVSGSVLGATQSFTWANGSLINLGTAEGMSWTATLAGTNDTITFNVVPEPDAFLLFSAFCLMGLWRRCRP